MPDCDLCKRMRQQKIHAKYDAATRAGPWAYMCEEHFSTHGIGLGIGLGQLLQTAPTDPMAYAGYYDEGKSMRSDDETGDAREKEEASECAACGKDPCDCGFAGDTREAKRERNRDIPDFDREASEDPRYDYEYGAQESAMKDARGNSMRANEREAWEEIMRASRYGMCDETPETSQAIIKQLIIIAAMRLVQSIK